MNEEEKKAIERLEEQLNFWKKQNIKNSDCEIILNLITKLQKENEEKDKQIDLMANSILAREIGKNSCQFNKTCTKFEKGRDIHCKHCIEQYFERKAEDEK